MTDTLYWLNWLRQTMLQFPATEEYLCYRTPAFRVKKKMIARLREDGETLVIHADDRDIWMQAEPGVFYVTDHYYNYPLVLINLHKVSERTLRKALTEAWLQLAPEKVINQYLSQQQHD
jgi:hypothetical protein